MDKLRVKAADNVEVPLEDGRTLKPADGVVELDATVYNRRRVNDGDLIVVDETAPIAKTKGGDK